MTEENNAAKETEVEVENSGFETDEIDETVGDLLSLIHGNLTTAFIEEIRNLPDTWQKLSEDGQDEIIQRCQNRAEHHIRKIASAILGRDYERCTAIVDTVTHKEECKAVLKTHDVEGGLMLAQRAGGKAVLVIFSDQNDYLGSDKGMPEKDKRQGDLLDVNGGGDGEPEEVDEEQSGRNDPLYDEAADFVLKAKTMNVGRLQKKLKIGYNRAALLLEQMQIDKYVLEPNKSGVRKVIQPIETESVKEDSETESDEELETKTDEPNPILHRVGIYDLIVDGAIETSVNAKDLFEAAVELGYNEIQIMEQGTEAETAMVKDDDRVKKHGAVVSIAFSDEQLEGV